MPKLDDAAFEGCYHRVFPLVLAKCRRMLKGDADANDMAQEVFVRLWKNRDLVQDPQALTAWLYRTSSRLVIDRARQRSLTQESLTHLHALLQGEVTADSEARFASRQRLRSVLTQCSEAELEAAVLNRVDRMTQPEVAEVMGISERSVRRLLDRFDRATAALQEALR
jgi:RNA polymerase sigma-70 factor, ECF subfamily